MKLPKKYCITPSFLHHRLPCGGSSRVPTDTAPAPAPVLPWWEYTAEPASAPVLPWWDYTPEPVEAPVDNAPSPVSPPITPSEAPLPAGTEEPTQSPVATGPAPPEAPLPTPSPVDVEEPVAPTPTAPEEQEPGVDDVDVSCVFRVGTQKRSFAPSLPQKLETTRNVERRENLKCMVGVEALSLSFYCCPLGLGRTSMCPPLVS